MFLNRQCTIHLSFQVSTKILKSSTLKGKKLGILSQSMYGLNLKVSCVGFMKIDQMHNVA